MLSKANTAVAARLKEKLHYQHKGAAQEDYAVEAFACPNALCFVLV